MAITEIRVRIEDALLASRFGDEFSRLSARSVRLHSFHKVKIGLPLGLHAYYGRPSAIFSARFISDNFVRLEQTD